MASINANRSHTEWAMAIKWNEWKSALSHKMTNEGKKIATNRVQRVSGLINIINPVLFAWSSRVVFWKTLHPQIMAIIHGFLFHRIRVTRTSSKKKRNTWRTSKWKNWMLKLEKLEDNERWKRIIGKGNTNESSLQNKLTPKRRNITWNECESRNGIKTYTDCTKKKWAVYVHWTRY